MTTIYKKKISEPWFSLIKLKMKTVEGRLNKGDFSNMKQGDIILFENYNLGFRRELSVKILKITSYPDFKTLLETENLQRVFPGLDTIEDGLILYEQAYEKEEIESKTAKAFTFTKMRE